MSATRVALAAVALASCLAVCTGAAARPSADLARNRTTAGTGIMALGCSLGNFSTAHLQRFRYVVFSHCDSSRARRLPGTTLHYFSPVITNDRFSDGTVTVAQAKANGWVLADAAGRYVHPYRDEHRWLSDVGNAAYRRATVQAILTTLSGHPGIDGVELDNIVPDVAYFNINGTWPAKYPNARAWQAAQASFVRAVGRALRSRGYYVMVNGTGYTADQAGFDSGAFSRAWYARLAKTKGVNAIFAEEWLQNPNDHSSLMDNSDPGDFMTSWAGWQQLVKACQKNGVDFFGGVVGPPGDKRKMRYGRGAFLLDWDGAGGMFFYAVEPAYGGPDSWDAVWTRGIGSPRGAKVRLATNVWHRAYSRGWVVVNANESESWTGTVNGARVTVPAKDAIVRFGSGSR